MSSIKRVSFDAVENFDKELIYITNQPESFEENNKRSHILKVMRNIYNNELTRHQKIIYKMYYADGKNSRVIAEELGVSQSAVTKSLRQIRCKVANLVKLCL